VAPPAREALVLEYERAVHAGKEHPDGHPASALVR